MSSIKSELGNLAYYGGLPKAAMHISPRWDLWFGDIVFSTDISLRWGFKAA